MIEEASSTAVKTAYPNPFTDNFSISFSAKQDQPVEVTILNTSGQKVFRKIQQADKGSNDFIFNEIAQKQLKSGLYFVKIKVDNVIHTQKIIKN